MGAFGPRPDSAGLERPGAAARRANASFSEAVERYRHMEATPASARHRPAARADQPVPRSAERAMGDLEASRAEAASGWHSDEEVDALVRDLYASSAEFEGAPEDVVRGIARDLLADPVEVQQLAAEGQRP